MSDFTPGMKERVEENLRKMNEELDKANTAAEQGKNGEAIDHIKEALTYKAQAIASLPGMEDKDGKALPFFAVYDTFFDADRLADFAGTVIAVTNAEATPAVKPEDIDSLIGELGNAIEEIKRNLLKRFKFSPAVEQILKDMIEALEKIRQLLRDLKAGKKVNWADFEGEQRFLRALKKAFFDAFTAPIALWDVYSLFAFIDELLLHALALLGRNDPPDSRPGRMARGHIKGAKAAKEKLEGLVHRTATTTPSEPPKPMGPPTQPKPEYPPGSEDLPPFPPPDWAMRRVRDRA